MSGKLLGVLGFGALGLAATVPVWHSSAATDLRAAQPLAAGGAERCAQLAGQKIADATIVKAEFVGSGATLPPFSDKTSFAFCRVDAQISAVPGSEIKIQIWLPEEWNGKFAGLGGGGFEGGYASAPLGLRGPVSNGYAAVTTDAGHTPAPEPKWALGAPEKLIDYGHRANHLGAVVGKAIVAAYYGKPAERAYFHGCSNGGRDALMLAQRHPQDYDAIAVGAPANDFTGLMASFARTTLISRAPGVDLTAAKLKLVHDAVVKQCDAKDGVTDGLIERPSACRFDPAELQCKAGADKSCLSQAEAGAVAAIHRGAYTREGREVMPGYPVGSEYEWANWLTAPKSAGAGFANSFYRYLVYQNPRWDVASFDLDRDHAVARMTVGPAIDAVDPDLRPFLQGGGKLLMYHGWDDAAIPAGNTLRYYAAMKRASGRLAAKQTRLFMLPGVAHCAGGNGPSSVDYFAELDRWSGSGVAPERIVAAKPDSVYRAMAALPAKTLQTRPLCVWPKAAHYKGSGSIDDAANFVCR